MNYGIAVDGSKVPYEKILPCGSVGYWDQDCGYAYRCTECMAIWISVKTPDKCRALGDKDE